MPCREDHAHEEEEEKQTRFFNLTHELNVWMKHKYSRDSCLCAKPRKWQLCLKADSRQQWPCTGRGRWLKALEVKLQWIVQNTYPWLAKPLILKHESIVVAPLLWAAHSSQSVFFRNKAEEWFCEITMVYTPITVKFSRHLCKLTVGE